MNNNFNFTTQLVWWLYSSAEIKQDSMIYLFYHVVTFQIYELTLLCLPGGSHQKGRHQIISKHRTFVCLKKSVELSSFVWIILKDCVYNPAPLSSLLLFVRWRDGRYLGKHQPWPEPSATRTHQYSLMTVTSKKHKLDAKWTQYILVNYFLLSSISNKNRTP